jgi:hypothetical protein
MASTRDHEEQLEAIMNGLAESLMGLSDEEILSEARHAGVDPIHESEQTRGILRSASNALELVNQRLWALGHVADPKLWYEKDGSYHTNCLDCGSLASFTPATSELGGLATRRRCSEAQATATERRRATSGL